MEKENPAIEYKKQEREKSIYCLCSHFISFYNQCLKLESADFGKSCLGCPLFTTCKGDWQDKILPFIKESGLAIDMGHSEQT